MQTIKTVGVVGAGTMGHGIAQVLVKSGIPPTLCDVSDAILTRAAERIS